MKTLQQIETHVRSTWARNELSERERSRQQELQRTVRNDARLLAPTTCKALKLFCVAGKQVQVGTTVVLAKHDADSLQALGKVTIV